MLKLNDTSMKVVFYTDSPGFAALIGSMGFNVTDEISLLEKSSEYSFVNEVKALVILDLIDSKDKFFEIQKQRPRIWGVRMSCNPINFNYNLVKMVEVGEMLCTV